jgi:hypothetical protein
MEIYTEGLTRTNMGASPVWMTFTPLLGVSSVVKRFLHEKSDDRCKVVMTLDDVGHYSEDEKNKIIASYPAHELEARTKGIPVLGSGRIFPVSEEEIAIDHRDFPPHWPRIGGMDFGWDHPFAAVELVWDRDADVVYVSKTHRLREATPIIHAGALRAWGKELPWAWPRDGRRETLEGAGVALAEQYRAQDLNMLYEHAQFADGSVSVEAGLMDMLVRMQTGRVKVFKHLNDWWEEFRLYHRKDGKVVKEGDDLMAATRYALMMLRHASTKAAYDRFRRHLNIRHSALFSREADARISRISGHDVLRCTCPLLAKSDKRSHRQISKGITGAQGKGPVPTILGNPAQTEWKVIHFDQTFEGKMLNMPHHRLGPMPGVGG